MSHYLVDKKTKKALSYGPLPESWGTISGLAGASDATAGDLTWAGYPNHAFVKEAVAVALGIDASSMQRMKEIYTAEQLVHAQDRAKQELFSTDWCELPSVRNLSSVPHLLNGQEFDAYRQELRRIAIGTDKPDNFPVRPVPIWSRNNQK